MEDNSKTCAELFSGQSSYIVGNKEEVVHGIAYRSDCVQPGDAFFCIVGLTVDGHSFAQDAIKRGAKVLVVERKLYLADATDVTEVVVSDTRKALAETAARFYDRPSESLSLIGITGTNGKTTVTYLTERILRHAQRRCGIIGTTGIRIDGEIEPSARTTPESSDLQALLARMRDKRCKAVAMEVSSQGLDLLRTWATTFEVTAFTNLTQDHLDYHLTFEAYFEAKARLFGPDYPAKRVICIDDAWGKELLRRCSAAGDEVITTGFDSSAQIHPLDYTCTGSMTHLDLDVRGNSVSLDYSLAGRFNVSNVMTAFGIALALGIDAEIAASALRDAPVVPGRLERVKTEHDGDIDVFVDYAHTPDALAKVIASVKELGYGNLWVVFGCGGDRDSSKRPIMGQVALTADYVIVTSDNPRSEDPDGIIADIVDGMGDASERVKVVSDRRAAIACAIEEAAAGDAVLVAGKGHETYQIIGKETLPFDDRAIAIEELERRFDSVEADRI